ncbi:hypothetical protein HPB48_005885 [Haemaphysalis longicornis]|uniref:Peptidase M13 N-terminal domain-containing protein n=1 Tax=Haemaphysalis longicornis TaxID=44386 RepID=A0A9J6GN22_HAELO|nr:hypothetical protein HPB48_005885 [Haemaphysalis longicornis]
MHGLHYHLTASVVAVVLAAMIFIAVALGRQTLEDGRDNTCHTHECRDYARRLALSLNTSVSPCHGFTRFVCDGWQRDNRMSVKHDLDWQLLDRIERLVRRMHIPTANQSEPQKAAALYISCDDVVRGNRDDLAAVKAALAEAGITWPHRGNSMDVVHLLLSASVKLGWDVYLRVVPGRFGNRDGVLIDRGALFGHVARRPAMQSAAQEDYFNTLRESFADNATESGGNDTTSFEETMAAEELVMPILQKAYGEARNPIELSPGTLSGSQWGLKELETRWHQTLEQLGFRMPADTNFHVARPAYVKTFARMWRLLGDANLYDVVSWGTVQVAVLYANRNLTLNFYRGHQPFLNHGAFCLSVAYRLMGHALSRMYSAKVLTQHTLEGAKEITGRVREAVRQRLLSWRNYDDAVAVVANWRTLDTAFAAFSYTTNVTRVVHFDVADSLMVNWQRSVRMTDGNDWDVGVVDALASRQLSALLPGDDFQLMPYSLSFLHFHPDLDAALNFGGIGTIVAQALGRLFVAAYVHEASNGRLFSAFSDCILSGAFSRGQDVDITMAEVFTFSTLVGAYKGAVASGKSGIVGLETYNGLQLLFIAACYLKCEGSDVGNSERLCDISFQHVPEFSEAFKCDPGTPLNPFNKCALSQK